jgi:subtilisin family serine protease
VRWLRIFLSLTLLVSAGTGALADALPRTEAHLFTEDEPKLHPLLRELMRSPTSGATLEMAELRGTSSAELTSGRVRVILETYDMTTVDILPQVLRSVGGEFEGSFELFAQALVPIASLSGLAARPEVRAVRFPQVLLPDQGIIVSEGRRTIGADVWQQAGLRGQGVKVAIIDVGFRGYRSLLGQELPLEDRVTARGFGVAVEGFSNTPDDVASHGTGVAEIVYDIAPEAQFFLVSALTVEVNVPQAVNFLIAQGVHVINTSWGTYTGCLRESSPLERQIQRARQAGIIWVTAAGNDAQGHWQGTFRDDDNNGRLNFTATDETNSFQADQDDIVNITLSWEDPCRSSPNDYDLLLLDSNLNVIARSAENNRRLPAVESIRFRIPQSGTYHIAIERAEDSQPVELDLSLFNRRLEYSVAAGSVSFFEPSISPNALTVGATFWQSHRLERFSSQGPTKDGRRKPDLSAPDGVTTRTFDPFFGTSASSPHVAGAAALVKQAFPNNTAEQIQGFLTSRTEDLGPPGPDNQFGAGLLVLGQPPSPQPRPAIADIEPASGLQGATLEATISGANLSGATSVTFSSFGVTAVIRPGGTESRLPITLTISPDAPAIARTFAVHSPNGTAASGRVTFTVLPAPRIHVEPESFQFQATVGMSDPPAQTLQITNAGGGTLRWQASVDVPWLQLNSSEGTAPMEIHIAVKIAGLAVGTHGSQITIRVPDALNSPLIVPVTLTLQAPAAELIALVFERLEFLNPPDWSMTPQGHCTVHRNVSGEPSLVRVTLPDGTRRQFEVPAGREVIVCGDVAHIDTRR